MWQYAFIALAGVYAIAVIVLTLVEASRKDHAAPVGRVEHWRRVHMAADRQHPFSAASVTRPPVTGNPARAVEALRQPTISGVRRNGR